MPPPRVRPATPVEARKPDGVAMPNATVAWSTSPQVQPASARTVCSPGSTVVLRSSERSMTSASSADPETGGVVAAAADRDLDAVLPGEVDAR